MKRLMTKKEFVTEEELSGSDLWIATKFEFYINAQRWKMARDEVSTSMYLYGVEAKHFDNLIVNQLSFVSTRETYVGATIGRILMIDSAYRDDERLRACIKAREWCRKMAKEMSE